MTPCTCLISPHQWYVPTDANILGVENVTDPKKHTCFSYMVKSSLEIRFTAPKIVPTKLVIGVHISCRYDIEE